MRLHLRVIHHLPSWQGGDIDQPLCRVPNFGAAARAQCAGHKFAATESEVDCQRCVERLAIGTDRLRLRRIERLTR